MHTDYDAMAGTYDSRYTGMQSQIENAQVSEVLRRHIRPYDTVSDVGCGTGFLLDVIGIPVLYTGYDISPAMLQRARAKHPDSLFVRGGCDRLERGQDAVTSLFSLPYIDDGDLDRIPGAISPHGRFIAVYYDRPYLNPDSVYHGHQEDYEGCIRPRLDASLSLLDSMMTRIDEGPIGGMTYRYAVWTAS